MKPISEKAYVILASVFCALAMSFVDAVLQPGYALKSGIKILLFLLVPLWYFRQSKGEVKSLFLPKKKELLLALGLGLGVYAFITGGYLILKNFIDISDMVLELTSDAGVDAGNFVYVSIYISLVNSMLEEFIFRGFAFLTLKKLTTRCFAYLFSACVFSLYHFGMMAAGGVLVSVLGLIGLFIAGCMFNWLNERSENIITSWLVHMFANLAINTIGFMIFGIL